MIASDLTVLDQAEILAFAARIQAGEGEMGDQSYRLTPIGAHAGRYLDELRFNNYSPSTVKGREEVLRVLAFKLAHMQPADVTLGDLKVTVAELWADLAPNSKATYISHVRSFFQWLEDNEVIVRSPARRLKGPKVGGSSRQAYDEGVIRRLVLAQDNARDRIALLVLYWCGLRRNELRLVQFRHIDLTHRLLTVFGKGDKVVDQNIPGQLALDLERYVLDRQPTSEEYLLYPLKRGRRGTYPNYSEHVIWENRLCPYSLGGIDRWFQRCRARAGLEHIDMHELRHSAGTHFHRAGHDLVATQHFMRHENPATTARNYIHLDRQREVADVQRRMRDPLSEDDE